MNDWKPVTKWSAATVLGAFMGAAPQILKAVPAHQQATAQALFAVLGVLGSIGVLHIEPPTTPKE